MRCVWRRARPNPLPHLHAFTTAPHDVLLDTYVPLCHSCFTPLASPPHSLFHSPQETPPSLATVLSQAVTSADDEASAFMHRFWRTYVHGDSYVLQFACKHTDMLLPVLSTAVLSLSPCDVTAPPRRTLSSGISSTTLWTTVSALPFTRTGPWRQSCSSSSSQPWCVGHWLQLGVPMREIERLSLGCRGCAFSKFLLAWLC